ncbi:MAG: hypothetical protein HY092_02415 [Candidatus Kerfeldbacteria bacterium]|nr:hypothetical protein [Candidatus Kerfeldbacteria bacterium]
MFLLMMLILSLVCLALFIARGLSRHVPDANSARHVIPVAVPEFGNAPQVVPVIVHSGSLIDLIERVVKHTRRRLTAQQVTRIVRQSGLVSGLRVRNTQALLNRLATNHHTVARHRPHGIKPRERRRATLYSSAA